MDKAEDVGDMEAEEGRNEQQDGNDQAANYGEPNVTPIPQDELGPDPVDIDSQPDSHFLTSSVDQLEDVDGMEAKEGEMEQQDENDQTANVSPFPQDQPGFDPVDVGSQPDSSGAGDPVVNTLSEQEHFPPHLMNTIEEKEDGETFTDEDEDEFLVLDAEHPLVAKKQAALKNQLDKELERLTMQLRQEVGLERIEAGQTEDLYVQVFREQERLKGLQARLDDQQKSKLLGEENQRLAQEELKAMRARNSNIKDKSAKTRVNASKLQTELEKLNLHVTFAQQISEDLQANVKATKNMTKKVSTEKSKVEDQKLKQDLYVERLTSELDKLKEQKDLYEVQTYAQAETTQATKEALSEAEMQMESLAMAQKQLLQQWNSSLLNMRKQDEEFGALQQAINIAEHQVIVMDREIDGNKKYLSELQEKSETLTMLLNCAEMDCDVTKKMIAQKQAQHEALQEQYSIFLRALGETERTLEELTKTDNGLQDDATAQRRMLEKSKNRHLEIENSIMTQMLQKIMDNKAAQYYQRLTNKKAALKKEKVFHLWQLESSVMTAALESNVINEKLENLARTQKELDEEIRKYNKVIASNETNSSSIDALIGQKQTTIANINKKIELIAARTGRWLSLLMKQREQLLRDSVAVVERRGYIIERNEVMARSTQKPTVKGELNLMNDGLRRKIKDTNKLVKEYDQEIRELQEGQDEFQNKAKKIQEMIDGTPSTTTSLEAALQGETERLHEINNIIHRVWVEMPKYQGALWKVLRSLSEFTDLEGGINRVE
ncbi:coiled-coil domain-containing protein 40-like isoform X2 [Syngnathus typhle]|uniref:coiled-coil domain-containing protein 40-like isoform X2 n=1 Tax=Syngnathus typhle TaxID=161592 RepID=UPI002A6ACDFC|nr:coiled-coil domain-containing protein 40-like isoform X2 [Syngnathus typhle]